MLTVVEQPAALPMDSADPVLRQHLALDPMETEFAALVDGLCAAAVGLIEHMSGLRLITQTLRIERTGFGKLVTPLPVAPIQSVAAVRYVDPSGTWQDLATDTYRLVPHEGQRALAPVYGHCWPSLRPEVGNVQIDLVVGFGATGSAIPDPLMQALRLHVAHLFLNREATTDQALNDVPLGVKALVATARVYR